MQKKTEPRQILFATLAPGISECILQPHPALLISSFLQCQHLQAQRDPDPSPWETQFPLASDSPPCSDHEAVSFIKGTSLSACLSWEPSKWEFLANSVHWQAWTDGCLDETTTFVSGRTHMSKWPKMRKSGREEGQNGAILQAGKNIYPFLHCI